ncbi:hypothetical protein KC19_6G018100 [Ceratodon purpureus]|uniref:Uncharacterized protein n=1 Tax=Ceratodon purpureus TaxID=3225 RepID=A0A8T0H909_CERPU|nr:hypothetical protein KC19_6G018100 [Ceratodon purpureus]
MKFIHFHCPPDAAPTALLQVDNCTHTATVTSSQPHPPMLEFAGTKLSKATSPQSQPSIPPTCPHLSPMAYPICNMLAALLDTDQNSQKHTHTHTHTSSQE